MTKEFKKAGETYQSPKKWGDPLKAGDIFQVTKEYIEAHKTTAVEGDYYIALKDSAEKEKYPTFPDWLEQKNEYFTHAWTTLGELKLSLANGATSGTLYGNGLNQLAVIVLFKPLDQLKRNVPLSPAVQAAISINLINYTKGEALPEGWKISEQGGEFVSSSVRPHNVTKRSAAVEDNSVEGFYSRTLYISCVEDEKLRQISIGTTIKLPGGQEIVDWQQGLSGFHVKLELNALFPILYTISNTKQYSVFHSVEAVITKTASYTNYYLSPASDGFIFIKSKKIRGLMQEHLEEGEISRKLYYASGIDNEMSLRFIYFWNITAEAKTEKYLGYYGRITAEVNDRAGAVTLTRTHEVKNIGGSNQQDSRECVFEVFDQYGNRGQFKNDRSTGLWEADRDGTDPYWYDVHFVDG